MESILQDPRLDGLAPDDRLFVSQFDAAMKASGFPDGGAIGPGFCWGRHLIAYARGKAGAAKAVARIYVRDDGIALRLYLSDIDGHRPYVERLSAPLVTPFLEGFGDCHRCHNERPDGTCKFRKNYVLHDRAIAKCNGLTFEYPHPRTDDLDGYMELLREFRLAKPLAAANRNP